MLFESMNTPGVGHQRVFDFIKQLHETIENYRVKFVTMGTNSELITNEKKIGKQEGLNKIMSSGIGPRKRSDPKYDNEEYIAEMEAKLLKSLGIPTDEI